MPQINFAEAFAEEKVAAPPHPIEPPRDLPFPAEIAPFIEPSRFRSTRLGRSEWANIFFAALTIGGSLFCAFYFFNGAELVRSALAWPGEFLYPRPIAGSHLRVATSNVSAEPGLPGVSPEKRSSRPDSGGDPFSRTQRLISLDRPLGSFGRGGGLSAGTPPPVLPPPVFGSPVPPGAPGVPGVPGLPGGPVGGLPGPGTLLSRLTLLLPGGDALTHALQSAAATVTGQLVVNVRHDVARAGAVPQRIVRRLIVRPSTATARAGKNTAGPSRRLVQNVTTSGSQIQQGISNGLGAAGNAQERMNSNSGAVSIGTSAGAIGGGIGGTVGGVTGGLGGGLRGTIGGTVGGVGGAVGGVVGGVGGLLGGGSGRH